MDWPRDVNMTEEQKKRMLDFVTLMAHGISDRLLQLIPTLRNAGRSPPVGHGSPSGQPMGAPIRPQDPNFPIGAVPKDPPKYAVHRRVDSKSDETQVEMDSVPQLLAELNDNIIELLEKLDKRSRRSKS
jgi:hypothetical protein